MRSWNLSLALSLLFAAAPLAGQDWRSGADVDVVRQAATNRSLRDADAGLAGWQARARGLLRFAAVIDHGNGPVERVIRADELELEVYGEAPSRSKQVITAWRDTTFQPTSIVYHRDHLGIVANDFGTTIRLGEGDEVRDVPHPLSPGGLDWYQFLAGDTLLIASGAGTIRVIRVAVRPRDPEQAGVIGTMLLDIDRATLVRLEFTFTRASYRDPTVASINVLLESALHGQSHWLPRRQAIAIHRAAAIIALPLSTVIRADWVIDDYRLGISHPPDRFAGATIDGLRRPGGNADWSRWSERLAAAPLEDDELDAVTSRAREMVAANLLDGMPSLRLLADGGVSNLLSVNRVQGATVGAGVRIALPLASEIALRGAVGTSDGSVTGAARVSRELSGLRVGIEGASEIRDVHQWQRRSRVSNSLHTAMRGEDAGDWLRVRDAAVFVEPNSGLVRRISMGHQSTESVAARFTSLDGSREVNPGFAARDSWLARVRLGQGPVAVDLEGGSGDDTRWLRVVAGATGGGPWRTRWRLDGGWGSRMLPADRSFAIGGAGLLTGTVPRSVSGTRLLRAEVELPIAVDLPLPLWNTPLASSIRPFVAAAIAGGRVPGSPWGSSTGVRPSIGIRFDLWGPLVRVELGWAPRDRGWGVSGDAHPYWWPLL
jgi:hypothetical protein